MKVGHFVHKIDQFEPNTGQNTQDRCVILKLIRKNAGTIWYVSKNLELVVLILSKLSGNPSKIPCFPDCVLSA